MKQMVEMYIKLAELETKKEVNHIVYVSSLIIRVSVISTTTESTYHRNGILLTRPCEQDTNKKVTLPREIRSVRRLELVSIVCSLLWGSFLF